MKKDKDIEEEWNLIWSCRNGAYIINKQKLEMIRREIAKQAVQEYKKELLKKSKRLGRNYITIRGEINSYSNGYNKCLEEVTKLINQ